MTLVFRNIHSNRNNRLKTICSNLAQHELEILQFLSACDENKNVTDRLLYTAVSRKVVQLKSIKANATIPKGMMGCGCLLLHHQVHEFSARWKAVQ